jgi:hypothetical protein
MPSKFNPLSKPTSECWRLGRSRLRRRQGCNQRVRLIPICLRNVGLMSTKGVFHRDVWEIFAVSCCAILVEFSPLHCVGLQGMHPCFTTSGFEKLQECEFRAILQFPNLCIYVHPKCGGQCTEVRGEINQPRPPWLRRTSLGIAVSALAIVDTSLTLGGPAKIGVGSPKLVCGTLNKCRGHPPTTY